MVLLLSGSSAMAVISIMLILAIALYASHLVLYIRYMLNVAMGENIKAEKSLAIAGYYSIATFIVSFIILTAGYKHTVVKLEYDFLGLLSVLGMLVIAPFLIIMDIKQIKWIKSLSKERSEEIGINLKDRRPLIFVLLVLATINIALLGMNIAAFSFIAAAI